MAEVITHTEKGLSLDIFCPTPHLPPADLPTHALKHGIFQKRTCLHNNELNEKWAFYSVYSSKSSNEPIVTTGPDTRV